jgi:hypothetical protein
LDKRSGEKAWAVHGMLKLFEAGKGERKVNGKVKSMLIILFDIKSNVHKKFFMAGQTVNSAYYSDVSR